MKYFKIAPYCVHVKGKNSSSIYNLSTGDIVKLDKEFSRALAAIENNKINRIQNYNEIISKMIKNKLGHMYSNKPYIYNIFDGKTEGFENALLKNNSTIKAFIEIESECNLDCKFCTKTEIVYRKTGCKKWKHRSSFLLEDELKDILRQLKKLGCRQLIFIGGEPFLNYKQMVNCIKYAKKIGIHSFVIFTNGVNIKKEYLDELSHYNVMFNVQIICTDDEIGSKITGTNNYYKKIKKTIDILNLHKMKYFYTLLICKLNESMIQKMLKDLTTISQKVQIQIQYIYPNNQFYSESYNDVIYHPEKSLQRVNSRSFGENKMYHNCFKDQIAITRDGKILPCIMMRKFILGDYRKDTIHNILKKSQYRMLRYLNKDKIQGCSNCSLRYGCFDCRAIESVDGQINSMKYCNIAMSLM